MIAMNACIIVAVAAAGLFFGTTSLGLAEEKPIRIGVLNDMSGPYADYQGQGGGAKGRGPLCRSPEQAGCGAGDRPEMDR
jgi:hypothetical protein